MAGRVFAASSWYRIMKGDHAGKVGKFIGDVRVDEFGETQLVLDYIGDAVVSTAAQSVAPRTRGITALINVHNLRFERD